ncbi:MAG: hypothetical protein ACXWJZ_10890 [Burkholderiaceae bacterium]
MTIARLPVYRSAEKRSTFRHVDVRASSAANPYTAPAQSLDQCSPSRTDEITDMTTMDELCLKPGAAEGAALFRTTY